MHLPRLARFQGQAQAGARAVADEMMVEARHRQERGNGRAGHVHAPVGQDQDIGPAFDGLVRGRKEAFEGLFQAGPAGLGIEQNGQGDGLEPLALDAPQFLQLLVGEDGRVQFDHAAGLGRGLQQIAFRAQGGLARGDDLLADGVYGRVGDLGEELFEIVVQKLRLVGEHGQGCVRAHGPDGLHPVLGHGLHEDPQVLVRVSEGLLFPKNVVRILVGPGRGRLGQFFDGHAVHVEPFPVRMLGDDLLLDLLIRHNAALGGVNQKHAAGLKAPFVQHLLGRDVQHPHLGSQHHQVVLGHVVPRRTETVPVQRGAHAHPVREGHRGGAVPGLHEAGVVFVKGPFVVRHGLVVFPGLRDHHHHGVGQGAAGQHQKFQAVVEHGGVRPVGVDDGQEFFQVLAEKIGPEQRLPSMHPVDVAAQCVDFAIVDDVAVRVGPVPVREGVGGKARVHQGQGGRHVGIRQVGVVGVHLVGDEHALVHDGAAGQAGDVEGVGPGRVQDLDGMFGFFSDDVELALKGQIVLPQAGSFGDESLPNHRLGRLGRVAEGRVVRGHVAPAQKGLALLLHNLFEPLFAVRPGRRIPGQEGHGHAVRAGLGQGDARLGRDFLKKRVRGLEEDARAVSGVGLAAAGAPMAQVVQDGQGLSDDLVRLFPLDVDHEADAAGVVLMPGIVKALFFGRHKMGPCPFVSGTPRAGRAGLPAPLCPSRPAKAR